MWTNSWLTMAPDCIGAICGQRLSLGCGGGDELIPIGQMHEFGAWSLFHQNPRSTDIREVYRWPSQGIFFGT